MDLVNDDEPSEPIDEGEGNGVPEDIPEGMEVLDSPEALLAEERDRYLRLAAEFDNLRKRTERDMVEFKRRAADDVLLSLLEVVDNLDRALETSEGCTAEELYEGLKAIRSQMGGILSREGVEPIEATGKTFDPYEMEAVMRMPSADVADGDVVQVLQCGYRGLGYVLRPSKVIVSSGPPEPEVSTDVAGEDAGEDEDHNRRT
jgi:molecular chaperone GrpE